MHVWQTAHDVLVELKWITEAGSQAGVAQPLASSRKSRELLLLLLLATVSIALLIVAFVHFREERAELHPIRLQLPLAGKVTLDWIDWPVVSPDGTRVVFGGVGPEGKRLLWMHSLDSLSTSPLAGTEGAYMPFWSPDSRSIAFFTSGGLKRIDASGGPPQTICSFDGDFLTTGGGSWSQAGVIVFSTTRMALHRVSADGGEPQPASELNKARHETGHWLPHFLPDGRHFLYLSRSADADEDAIFVGSLDSGQTKLLTRGASNASYTTAGFLIYGRQQTVLAQKFDAKIFRLDGNPFPIAEQVGALGALSGAEFSVSQNGVLVYRSEDSTRVQLAWYNRDGRRLGPIGEPGPYGQIAISPDEKRLAIERDDLVPSIWTLELASGIFSRLTFNPSGDAFPRWSADGREVLYGSIRSGHLDLYRKPVGGGDEVAVYQSAENKGPYDWSRDGWILFQGGDRNFYRIPLAGERRPVAVLKSEFDKDNAAVSRDGRWVAYQSIESGRWEVYVASYPTFSGKRQVSNAGGCQPLWSRDGKELFYLMLDGKLSMVEVRGSATLESGAPKVLFHPAILVTPSQNEYCVTDSKKFIFRELIGDSAARMYVSLNWADGLKH